MSVAGETASSHPPGLQVGELWCRTAVQCARRLCREACTGVRCRTSGSVSDAGESASSRPTSRGAVVRATVWCALRSCREASPIVHPRTSGACTDAGEQASGLVTTACGAGRRVPVRPSACAGKLALYERLSVRHWSNAGEATDSCLPRRVEGQWRVQCQVHPSVTPGGVTGPVSLHSVIFARQSHREACAWSVRPWLGHLSFM